MTGEEWARLEEVFDEARQQPPDRRERWLAAGCADPELRRQVVDMLAAFDDDPDFLEDSRDIANAVTAAVAGEVEGQRLGAYRVHRQIGEGGMGLVYEAVRADDDFDRRVAIKVLPAWSGSAALERFRRERRLLAGLDHPGIARLIDSGTTPTGAPYFVMELVEGRPVDEWSRDHALTLGDRVALVERVCDAVAHAHQRLVVHRDIKPANLLVTPDGQPKLLDFGIATALSADGETDGVTRTGQRSFTPEFASPEQVRGEPVTTASDVYALGVLLYLLTTGQRPYRLQGLSPLDAMRVVCEHDPAAPSRVANTRDRPALAGPLDAVILRALRKAPEDRYPTVAALQADLAAWRQGLPVSAAPDPVGRRLSRFARRHRLVVAAAAAVLAALLVGGGVALWQARLAAEQRDRAERRFQQVQAFSRSLIFDVNDALSRVAGNTVPRRLLLDRAVQFLDGLAADAGDDTALTVELIEGYRRLGRVLGDPTSANLGDRAGAARTLEAAVRLTDRLLAAEPDRLAWLELALDATHELASVQLRTGDATGDAAGNATRQRRDALLAQLERLHGDAVEALPAIVRGRTYVGSMLEGDARHGQAEQEYRGALALLDRAAPSAALAHLRAPLVKRLGAVLQRLGRNDEAEAQYRVALALDEQPLAADPLNPGLQFDLSVTLSNLGGLLMLQGSRDDAMAVLDRSLAIRRTLVATDPGDLRAAESLAGLLGRYSTYAYEARQFDRSVAFNREKVALREAIVSREGATPRSLSDRALARLELAMALVAEGEPTVGAHRRRLLTEAERVLASVLVREYTTPSLQAAVSVEAFAQARASLAARLARLSSSTSPAEARSR
ncbi:serine/threonine-protein kinase [Luteitalea sp.]|uniref:serine/threonine-protein kinase n=1 Tax=Luteitalea sp. TaxID=2004800 RepID=UPI0025BF7594|nr:serine/threonine-protein kinase [Luteitalea sp.]